MDYILLFLLAKSIVLDYNLDYMIYDRFQQEAIEHINNGHSVIVSAPTGAGKTAIAEHVIRKCLEKNIGVIYTAPIKALSNQKFRDFQIEFKDYIGILTGDVSINANAPVLIMTTEIFRNKILDQPESLAQYKWIIFDEIHYIDNPERGTVWEESLIFLPQHIKILGLSATIPNIDQFASWIESIHKKEIKVVIEDKRPVPLHFLYQCQNQIVEKIEMLRKMRMKKPNIIATLIHAIKNKSGLPCIYFVFGRRRAEELAYELFTYNFLTKEEQVKIMDLYSSLCEKYDLTHEKTAASMSQLISKGIAYHHAGMLPTLKEVVERLFTSRLLKVIFTTETFALGINMPSRSVIFDDLRKFYGTYMRNLKTRDFYQMAGRAGRRGIDNEGFVYCRVNLHRIDINELRRIIYGRPEEVRSQLNTSYATILNLYEKYKEELYNIYPKSLHYYQSKKHIQREALRLMESKLNLLKELGHIENGILTPKGQFAKVMYGYELLLAEFYEEKIFEHLDEFGLGILAVASVFEPRKNQKLANLTKEARPLFKNCHDIFEGIRYREIKYKVYPFSKATHFHLAKAIEMWMRGEKFSRVLQFTDTDEGEVVRYFRMAIQIMREMIDSPASSYILKDRIKNAIRLINRDVVDAEKQLREG
ncbi:MAG: DEAD/DEAH box helicase [Candidatus Omnitrophota bacterium]|nr:DEAD/DEAH box helicase [Candidatus Omnitrophota bacterium]